MKKLLLLGFALLTAFAIIAFSSLKQPQSFNVTAYKVQSIVRCSPDWKNLSKLLDQMDIPPMPDAGSYTWHIATPSDSAQFYFNQGINMYYGFHIIEALASFKKAARFDPTHPMIWWAQALAYGPNINDVGYSASPEVLDVLQKATSMINKASDVERSLITAMQSRYSADTTRKREKLNQDYADAMKKAYTQYPSHPDVAALFADALMLQHPWDLWLPNGTPRSWTPAIRTVLEKLLLEAPNHPGANHYYIHVMEASPLAYKAQASADRLGRLTPGLSHMVHMPSHIYLRMGLFNKGTQINEEAVKRYKQYAELFPAVQENAFLYQWHNEHMQANCALMAGRYDYAVKTAIGLQAIIDTSALSLPAPFGMGVQYIYMTPLLIHVHFGKWDELLNLPAPADHHGYASILYHFGRGMAYAGKDDLSHARLELTQLLSRMDDSDLTRAMGTFSPPLEGAKVSMELLQGFINMKEGQTAKGIAHFSRAAEIEGNMVYNEPRDWLLNPKQYLGAAYLHLKQWQNAENTFKRDLNQNAQNVWSLYGLLQALNQQNKKVEANIIRLQLDKAGEQSDIQLASFFY